MKKIFAIAAATLLVGTVHAQQMTGRSPVYGEIGYSQLKLSDGGPDAKPGIVRGIVGYEFHPYLAVEGMAGFGVKDDDVNVLGINVNNEVKHTFGIFAKPKYNFNDQFEVFGRVGYARTKFESSALGLTASDTKNDLAYGVGANWYFSPTAYVGVDYMTYFDKDDVKARGWTVGVGLKF